MSTIKIFKNYGCLAAEKRNVYTYGTEQPTATCADEITVKIPDGWKIVDSENDILFPEDIASFFHYGRSLHPQAPEIPFLIQNQAL